MIDNSSILLTGNHDSINKIKDQITLKLNNFSKVTVNSLINSVESLVKKIEAYRIEYYKNYDNSTNFYNNYPVPP